MKSRDILVYILPTFSITVRSFHICAHTVSLCNNFVNLRVFMIRNIVFIGAEGLTDYSGKIGIEYSKAVSQYSEHRSSHHNGIYRLNCIFGKCSFR